MHVKSSWTPYRYRCRYIGNLQWLVQSQTDGRLCCCRLSAGIYNQDVAGSGWPLQSEATVYHLVPSAFSQRPLLTRLPLLCDIFPGMLYFWTAGGMLLVRCGGRLPAARQSGWRHSGYNWVQLCVSDWTPLAMHWRCFSIVAVLFHVAFL